MKLKPIKIEDVREGQVLALRVSARMAGALLSGAASKIRGDILGEIEGIEMPFDWAKVTHGTAFTKKGSTIRTIFHFVGFSVPKSDVCIMQTAAGGLHRIRREHLVPEPRSDQSVKPQVDAAHKQSYWCRSATHAQDVASDLGLKRTEWIYVQDVKSLRGNLPSSLHLFFDHSNSEYEITVWGLPAPEWRAI